MTEPSSECKRAIKKIRMNKSIERFELDKLVRDSCKGDDLIWLTNHALRDPSIKVRHDILGSVAGVITEENNIDENIKKRFTTMLVESALTDPEADVRSTAANWLGEPKIGSYPFAVSALVMEGLSDMDDDVIRESEDSLHDLVTKSKTPIHEKLDLNTKVSFATLLLDEFQRRMEIAELFEETFGQELSTEESESIEGLINKLKNALEAAPTVEYEEKIDRIRRRALEIEYFLEEPVIVIRDLLLEDAGNFLTIMAGLCGNVATGTIINEALTKNTPPAVVSSATRALYRIGDPRSLQSLIEAKMEFAPLADDGWISNAIDTIGKTIEKICTGNKDAAEACLPLIDEIEGATEGKTATEIRSLLRRSSREGPERKEKKQ